MAKHNEVGRIGEDVASQFLVRIGYTVVERNFRKPYGEIDIVARGAGGVLIFVEVKTVSYETGAGVPYETYRPEENVHPRKLERMGRVIQAYLASKRYEGEWRFDVVAVFLDRATKTARVRHTRDIVIGA